MNHYGTLRDYRFSDKDADDIRGSNVYGLNDDKLGDIDDAEYSRREAVVMQRLREVRAWRERLGMATAGGPVRVARETDADDE